MVKKQYAPARVVNPTSLQHLVKLQPGQAFVLSLDKEIYSKPSIEITDDRLAIGTFEQKNGSRHYTFVQKANYGDWSVYSSCLLGEIWIDCKDGLYKLVVVQDCLNPTKSDHLTVVNPDHCDIRVLPHNIMEVVVYNKEFGYQDVWDWIWRPMMDGVNIEEIGSDSLSLYSWRQYSDFMDLDPPHYQYARFPRIEVGDDEFCRQHHFWFRFERTLLPLLEDNSGVRHVGDISLVGHEGKPMYSRCSFQASVYLDLRKKYRLRLMSTLELKKRDEYSSYTENYVQPRSSGIVHVPKRVHYQKPKPSVPVVKEVVISELQPESLEEGCKVLSAIPPENPTCQVPYDDDDYIYQQMNPHQRLMKYNRKFRRD